MAFPAILAAFLASYAGQKLAGPERPPLPFTTPPERRAGGFDYLPLPTINAPPVQVLPEPLPEPKPEEEPEKTQKPGQRITDAFLKSLVESLAQRIVSGGGGGGQTFTPPTFR